MNSLNFYRHDNKNRNILSNAAYFTANVKEPEYKCSVNYNLHESNCLQRSFSADNVVISSRGFKPSDIHDPAKRHFLENLTTKILHVDMDGGEAKRIDLQKLLTPANDMEELYQAKNKKMYASSYFYAPSHPTVEDQVELARRISHSLSDVQNLKSKGQSMYVNRKKRSVKWIHDGNGLESDEEHDIAPLTHKDKVPLKCMMNPNGKVLDIHGIQALGEEVNIQETPTHPEKLFDIVRDLNNQKGRGAEIFAKRRKRSEKWVVEKDYSQTLCQPSTAGLPWKSPYAAYPMNKQETEVKENSSHATLDPLPYNPFTLDLSISPGIAPALVPGNGYMQFPRDVGNYNGTKRARERNGDIRQQGGTELDAASDSFPFPTPHQRGRKPTFEARSTDSAEKSLTHVSAKRTAYRQPATKESRAAARPFARNASCHVPRRPAYRHPYGHGETIRPSDPKAIEFRGRDDRRYHDKNDHDDHDDEDDDDDDDDDGYDYDYEQGETEAERGQLKANGYDQCRNAVLDAEYTPIPVKQLIKEFEKTCRPAMQYKQNGTVKVAPQLYALDSDMISRYFEGRSCVPPSVKNVDDAGRVNNWEGERRRLPVADAQFFSHHSCDGDAASTESLFHPDHGARGGETDFEETRQRDWRLKYIDDEETSTSDDSISDESESPAQSLIRTFEETDGRCYRKREPSATEFGKAGPLDANDNALVLAMVASQEDILQTIKQLRRTPVLNNLIPAAASPELSRFSDVLPHVGNKLYENSEYQGPKLNSYQRLSNYNTAPRGWDQAHTYYRPIKFGRPQEAMVYSDF